MKRCHKKIPILYHLRGSNNFLRAIILISAVEGQTAVWRKGGKDDFS